MTLSGRLVLRLLLVGIVGVPTSAFAQIPGESVFDRRRSFREEYRSVTYGEVRASLDDWTRGVNDRKLAELTKALTEAIVFAPSGWSANGHAEVSDSLETWLPRITGYHLLPTDFDASGNLAYVFATVRYHHRGTAPTEFVGEAVMVLYRMGSRWKLRSYVERPLGGL